MQLTLTFLRQSATGLITKDPARTAMKIHTNIAMKITQKDCTKVLQLPAAYAPIRPNRSATTQTFTALDLMPCLLNSGLRSSIMVTKEATKEVELQLTNRL
jgi:hypothetical protein